MSNVRELKVGFTIQDHVIPAGEMIVFPYQGDFVRNMGASGDLHMGLNGGPRSLWPDAAFYQLPLGSEFRTVEIENKSGADVTLRLALALGRVGYDALQLASGAKLSVSANIASAADVAIGAGLTAQIAAVNAGRRELVISNLAGNASTLRIGDAAAGAGEGIELAVGATLILSTEAAVFAYNPGAAAQSVGVLGVLD